MDRRKRRAYAFLLFEEEEPVVIQNVPVASFIPTQRHIKKLIVGIDPAQDGTGDPTPQNVRPIVGRSAVNVVLSPTLDAQDGTTYPVSLGGTYYGGTLDVIKGILTIDTAYFSYTGSSSEYWTTYTYNNYTYFACSIDILRTDRSLFLCDRFTPRISQYPVSIPIANSIYDYYARGTNINIYYPDCATLDDFKQFLSNNPLHVLCKRATPAQYTLTPTQIDTIMNRINNVWADSGPIIELIS